MRRVAVVLLLALAVSAGAKETPQGPAGPPPEMVAVAEAVEKANAGDRRGAIRMLDAVIKDFPGNVDARVGRGVNHYMLGELEPAREDLAFAFDNEVWQVRETTSEAFTDVTTTVSTLDLVEQRKTGAAILVVLAARAGATTKADEVAQKARDTFGEHAQIQAAEARLMLERGDSKGAWGALDGALGNPDPTLFVQSIASEMVAKDPEHAPKNVKDWLKAAGQWTAHYNAAIGHLRTRQYGACVDEVAEGLLAFPNNPKMVSVGYPCAARANLARADEWVLAGGGAKHVEPWSVIAHARSLKKANRPDEALGLLRKMAKKLPGEVPAQRETLILEILLKAGRVDEAVHESKGHAAVAEVNVGYALIQAERWTDAIKLLERVCPLLAGQAAESNCKQQLEYAQSQLGGKK